MSTIIFATDYSPSAQNALLYAAELANYLRADLRLVHAYVIPFAYTDSPVPLLNVEEIQNIAEESMKAEVLRITELFPEMKITSLIIPGEAIDVLTDLSEKEPPLLVVLGTSGSGSESILWGSVAVKSLRTLTVPVLAVASDIVWKPMRNLCFAADYAEISPKAPFDKIISWTKKLSAKLFVIHIDQKNEDLAVPDVLQSGLSSIAPNYQSIQSEDMIKDVNAFLQQNAIDWLIVIPKKYGFLENLFHKSRTKIFAQGSNVPVLALHQI